MSGFIATNPIAPADAPTDALRSDGWWPDLSIASIRALHRLDGTITDERLRDAARYAIAFCMQQLAAFKAEHVAAGKAKLEDVSGDQLDGENRLAFLYRRAVGCTLKAQLVETYRDFDSTDEGLRRALDLDASIGELRRSASWAIRDLLGKPHSVVELI